MVNKNETLDMQVHRLPGNCNHKFVQNIFLVNICTECGLIDYRIHIDPKLTLYLTPKYTEDLNAAWACVIWANKNNDCLDMDENGSVEFSYELLEGMTVREAATAISKAFVVMRGETPQPLEVAA